MTFPPNAFSVPTTVQLLTSSDPNIAADFDESASIFRPDDRLPYELRIRTGALPPVSETVSLVLSLPPEFLVAVPPGHGIEVFAKALQGGGEDVSPGLDLFGLFSPTLASGSLSVDLPTSVFDERGSGQYEAVVTVASTPGVGSADLAAIEAAPCQATNIACPLGSGCEAVSSQFSPARAHPITGSTKPHWGVDFGVPVGTNVLAAAGGVIEKSYTSNSYGNVVVVRHVDGAATLYAHLSQKLVSGGQSVGQGALIGLSGNTGKSTGPHLHFEYVPNGEIIGSKDRIDPAPCLQPSGARTLSGHLDGTYVNAGGPGYGPPVVETYSVDVTVQLPVRDQDAVVLSVSGALHADFFPEDYVFDGEAASAIIELGGPGTAYLIVSYFGTAVINGEVWGVETFNAFFTYGNKLYVNGVLVGIDFNLDFVEGPVHITQAGELK